MYMATDDDRSLNLKTIFMWLQEWQARQFQNEKYQKLLFVHILNAFKNIEKETFVQNFLLFQTDKLIGMLIDTSQKHIFAQSSAKV